MPGTPEGVAKARAARAAKLEARRRREAADQAAAVVQQQAQQQPEQPADSAVAVAARIAPRELTIQALEAIAPRAAVLLDRVISGAVRASAGVRVQAAGMVLSSTIGPRASQVDQGSAAFALVAERIVRALDLGRQRREAVTIDQAPQGENPPKS